MADEKGPGGIGITSDFGTDPDAPAPKTTVGESGGGRGNRPAWRFLHCADLTPGRPASGPRPVDKNLFADLFATLGPSLAIDIPDPAGASGARIAATLTFRSLKDFTPDAIAATVPRVAEILRLRDAVDGFGKGDTGGAEFAAAIRGINLPATLAPRIEDLLRREAPATPAPPAGKTSGAVDDLLSMVDAGTPSPTVSGALDGLIQAVASGSTRTRRDVSAVLAAIDVSLSRIVDAVLHDPRVLALEAAWRELKLLVDRSDFRRGIALDVLACGTGEVRESLMGVFRPIWNDAARAYDAIVVAHPLSAAPFDVELLADLARLGESTQTLVIAAASHAFFGVPSFDALKGVPSVAARLAGPGYEKWRALREGDAARRLVLAANAFLLRDAYGPKGVPAKHFDYREGGDAALRPWGSAAGATAAVLVESLARIGTDRRLMTEGSRADLGDLPVLPVGAFPGRDAATTCAGFWSRGRLTEIADAGIVPLACHAGEAGLSLAAVSTAHRDGTSIPEAIVIGYLSRFATEAATRARGAADPDEFAKTIEAAVGDLLTPEFAELPADAVRVEAGPNPEAPGERIVVLDVHFPYRLLGRPVSAQIAFSI
jgi:hypothetical protein